MESKPGLSYIYVAWVLASVFLAYTVASDNKEFVCPSLHLSDGCTCNQDTQTVECYQNNLTAIPTDLPEDLPNLEIRQNHLEIITVVPHATLENLHMEYDRIRFITDSAFRHLKNLKSLSLAHNEISGINNRTFAGLHSLQVLTLEGNPIHRILAETFNGYVLPNLQVLRLAHCNLYEVADKALDSLNNLDYANMSYNNLAKVPVLGCPHHSLHHFQTWDLSHNAISELNGFQCHHLPFLKNLHLAHNQIAYLGKDALGGGDISLELLTLHHNTLVSVHADVFKDAAHLAWLDMSFNRLIHLDENLLNWDTMDQVLLHDNPWMCDCSNPWMVKQDVVIDSNANRPLRCALPETMTNKTVPSISHVLFDTCYTSSNPNNRVSALSIIFAVLVVVGCLVLAAFALYCCLKNRRNKAVMRNAPASHYKPMTNSTLFDFDYAYEDKKAKQKQMEKQYANEYSDNAGGGGGTGESLSWQSGKPYADTPENPARKSCDLPPDINPRM